MSFTTHQVSNQSLPLQGVNLFRANRPLRDALNLHAPGLDRTALQALDALGEELATAEMQEHARLANSHGPVLRSHDRSGHRIDEVEFHPSYHALMAAAMQQGLHGTPWTQAPGAHVERAAAFMLFTEAEPSTLCPISMTYAVTPSLRANRAVHAAWGAGLASRVYDGRFLPFDQKLGLTMGMGMTEKQGGSDVRANTTVAVPDGSDGWGQRFKLTGHKWFMSAPMCDAFLVLARTPGQSAGGLSCFFLPRWLPEARAGQGGANLNAIRVQRLKHKLGNQANASSEVEFDGATAWLVGEEGRGIPQILSMGAITRLDCALGTAGLMRQALSIALQHTAQRQAFGKRLIDQPMMQNVLADLALESEAATALALRLARAVDATENHTDPTGFEALIGRVLTPIAKFWVCKRGAGFAQEAMECLGGNGYVEEQGEGVMARIYREMPLNSIWEGAGNIMALDLKRALRAGAVADALAHEMAPAKGAHPALDAALARVLHGLDGGAGGPSGPSGDQAQARRLARDTALVLQAALLRQHSTDAVFAAFCASRLTEASDVYGTLPAGLDLAAIVARAQLH